MKKVILVFCLCCAAWGMRAQSAVDTLILDTLAIDPNGFVLRNDTNLVSDTLYQLIPHKSMLVIPKSLDQSRLTWSYRRLPYPTEIGQFKPYQRTRSTFKPSYLGDRLNSPTTGSVTDIIQSGALTRTVQVGNNQNLSLQSGLNLQLDGRINGEWRIKGQLSDAQLPLQAGGYSSKLEDFDVMNILLYNKTTQILAGDFTIQQKEGYFMRYFKRGQGLSFQQNNNGWKTDVALSLSKGRFARQSFVAIEGNQGPYRLNGANGENFIIILAGTEQVYIDGIKLQRGQDKDYVIDYNAGTITFMPSRQLTKDKRIVVEFQYSDKQYFRPLVTAGAEKKWEKQKMYWRYFNEWDAKNQPLQLNLSDSSRYLLSQSGDNVGQAFVDGARKWEGPVAGVAYFKKDTLDFGWVWEVSQDTTFELYQVVFSYAGQGQGNYVESGFNAGGKVYKWVAPVWDGEKWVKQGSYIDKAQLTAPKSLQMWIMGYQWQDSTARGKWIWDNELAMSQQDLNLFSDKNDGDNQGWALKSVLAFEQKRIKSKIDFEYNSVFFNRIERFREVEFERNWNLLGLNYQGDFRLVGGELSLEQNGRSVMLRAEQLQWSKDFSGQRLRWIGYPLNKKNLTWKWDGWALATTGERSTHFYRNKNRLDWTPGKLRIYWQDEWESNKRELGTGPLPYVFYDYSVGAGTKDTVQKKLVVFYRNRLDYLSSVQESQLQRGARAEQWGMDAAWQLASGWRVNAVLAQRQLMVLSSEVFNGRPESNWVGRAGTQWWSADRVWNITSYYELSTGLEQRRSYIYVEVPQGQGNFVWNDYNDNGIKELNEFEMSAFGYDANYIRTQVPNNDFVPVHGQKLSLTMQMKGNREKLRGWNYQGSLLADQQTLNDQWLGWKTFEQADSILVQQHLTGRNQLLYTTKDTRWTWGLQHLETTSLNALSLGYEQRSDAYWSPLIRYQWNSDTQLQPSYKQGVKQVASDFLAGRNYQIHYEEMALDVVVSNSKQAQLTLQPKWKEKQLVGETTEHLRVLEMPVQFKWNELGKSVSSVEIAWHQLNYSGQGYSTYTYDLLEGLQSGTNWTWVMQYQTIGGRWQWTWNYQGRKSAQHKAIHTGQMGIRLAF